MVHRRGRNAFIVGAAAVVVAYGLAEARPVLSVVLLAGFLAVTTAPLVLWLKRRRVPTVVAVLAGLLLDAAAVTAVGLVLGGAIAELGARQELYRMRIEELILSASAWLDVHGVETSDEIIPGLTSPGALVEALGATLKSLASVVSRLVLVLFVTGFMLVEATTLRSKIRRVLHDREELAAIRVTMQEVKAFLVVKLGTSAATGVLVGVWCRYLGVDLALLWGVLAFLLNFIPTVGSIIASIPPVILALVISGPGTALAVAGGYTVINAIIGSLIEPRLMGEALGLSPLVVFLSMLFWGYLLGPVGALLSGPLTMFLKNWLAHTEDLAWVAVMLGPAPEGSAAASTSDGTLQLPQGPADTSAAERTSAARAEAR
ncbi:MAG: AI-2E family transporter [Polyangiales bacterium]